MANIADLKSVGETLESSSLSTPTIPTKPKRIKKKHILNSDYNNRAWCTKKLVNNDYYYTYIPSRYKLYCGPCMRRMIDSLQRSLDATPRRYKQSHNEINGLDSLLNHEI